MKPDKQLSYRQLYAELLSRCIHLRDWQQRELAETERDIKEFSRIIESLPQGAGYLSRDEFETILRGEVPERFKDNTSPS